MNTATMLGLLVMKCVTHKLYLGIDYDPVNETWDVSFGDFNLDRYHYDNDDLDELLQLVIDDINDYTA